MSLATQNSPSIIILGIDRALEDGLETCHFLKNYHQTDHIPIMLLLGNSILKEQLVFHHCEADTFLAAPFKKEELMLQLTNWINLQEAWKRRYGKKDKGHQPNLSTSSTENSFITKLNHIIEKHLDNENLQISDLCSEIGLSHMQIHRKLKSLTGLSTANYIRNFRLKKSKPLLMHSDLTITEIAYNVGFRSIQYYTKSFKNSFGSTPTEFRASVAYG